MTANPDPQRPSSDDALAALSATGVPHAVTTHGPVASLEEAAVARGVEPRAIVKTLVVRRGDGDFLLVLVPGDRGISWPKLRTLLGVSRMSMPDAETARVATGYERGTITPFGSTTAWPVIADASIESLDKVAIGGGRRGTNIHLSPATLIAATDAAVSDVTSPES